MNRVKYKNRYINFMNLDYGDIFEHNHNVYMKIRLNEDEEKLSVFGEAVNLESGIVERFRDIEKMVKINQVEIEAK